MTDDGRTYAAFDLGIRSTVRLSPLPERDVPVDATVREAPVAPERTVTADTLRVPYEGVCRLAVRDGRGVLVDREQDASDDAVERHVLGPGLGGLLHQRGALVVHGCAVAVDGAAAVFLAPGGAGKSTLAAALHARGHGLLADDVTAMDVTDGAPVVRPGYPSVRLSRAAAGAVGDGRARLVERGSRLRYVPDDGTAAATPLRAVYVLASGDRPRVEPLGPREALVELVRGTYTASILDATGRSARHLDQCAAVARRARVARLHRPRDLDVLPALAAAVERDCRGVEP